MSQEKRPFLLHLTLALVLHAGLLGAFFTIWRTPGSKPSGAPLEESISWMDPSEFAQALRPSGDRLPAIPERDQESDIALAKAGREEEAQLLEEARLRRVQEAARARAEEAQRLEAQRKQRLQEAKERARRLAQERARESPTSEEAAQSQAAESAPSPYRSQRDGVDMTAYDRVIERAFKEGWQQPPTIPETEDLLRTQVKVVIAPDGTIREKELSLSSGNRELDQSVEAAIAPVDRIAPFPEGYREPTYEIVLTYQM
ncbi:MAG: TonB C-terminal domain-containing protein [Verrucomicrobiota bacterium]